MSVRGLLLAAGAGRRYGGPKALVPGWLDRAVTVLRDGGCAGVTVVLGAEAERVRAPDGVQVVVADDWAEGMGASLRAGLSALAGREDAEAVLVHLVDLPDVSSEVVRRVLYVRVTPTTLRRARYGGRPGHPVLLGRDHWAGVALVARGDRGARDYFRDHRPEPVECGDLATGHDVDRPAADRRLH